jgi:hypothetical protein
MLFWPLLWSLDWARRHGKTEYHIKNPTTPLESILQMKYSIVLINTKKNPLRVGNQLPKNNVNSTKT